MNMSDDDKPIRLLFADKDAKFAAKIKGAYKELKESQPDKIWSRPVFADTVRESQSFLSNREYGYAGIFVNPNLGSPAWIAVVRAAMQYRAGTPVYVLYEDTPKVTQKEIKNLGIQGCVQKEKTYEEFLKLVTRDEMPDDAPEALPAASSAAPVKKAEKLSQNPTDYVPVELENMTGSSKATFHLFVKVADKYVKIVNKGDVLSKDRIEVYKAKGVKELYIDRVEHEEFLAFCDKLTEDLLKDTSVSVEVKASQVQSQGENVSKFLKNSGFSEKSLEAAQKFVANSTEVLNQMASSQDAIKNIMNDVRNKEHGVACSTIAGLLIKYIGGNAAILNSAGIACFMHDASLIGLPDHVFDDELEKMTEEEKKVYLAHPSECAQLVKKVKGIPPAVYDAVLEHHLRINKAGFPADKLVTLPNRLAELIGISEEFVKLLKKADADPSIKPIEVLSARAPKEFSEPIVKAFLKAFSEK